MSFTSSRHSRQQLPEDSFYNDISQIPPLFPLDPNLDLFTLNDRSPEHEEKQQIQSIIKWASPDKSEQKGKQYAEIDGKGGHKIEQKGGKVPGKWVKPGGGVKMGRGELLTLKLGEENKVGEINQSMSTMNCSVMLNTTTSISRGVDTKKTIQQTSHILSKSYTSPISPSLSSYHRYTKIFPHPPSPPPPVPPLHTLYQIQHQSLLSIHRLQSLSSPNPIFLHELSALRRNLIEMKRILSSPANTSLSHHFQPFLSSTESLIQIYTYIQSSVEKLEVYEEMVKGIVREIVSCGRVMQLVKVRSVEKVLRWVEELGEGLREKEKEKGGKWGMMGERLRERIEGNVGKIKEVLELFDEEELRRGLGKEGETEKEEMLRVLRGEGKVTEVEREVMLEIHSALH